MEPRSFAARLATVAKPSGNCATRLRSATGKRHKPLTRTTSRSVRKNTRARQGRCPWGKPDAPNSLTLARLVSVSRLGGRDAVACRLINGSCTCQRLLCASCSGKTVAKNVLEASQSLRFLKQKERQRPVALSARRRLARRGASWASRTGSSSQAGYFSVVMHVNHVQTGEPAPLVSLTGRSRYSSAGRV